MNVIKGVVAAPNARVAIAIATCCFSGTVNIAQSSPIPVLTSLRLTG
ncbi:hypothetical protein [Proteus mirabilis]|nr:hypothetical protein [Proteus mirabilis]